MPRIKGMKSTHENTFIYKSTDTPKSRGISTIATNLKFLAARLIATQLTYQELADNFKKVFPNSNLNAVKLKNLRWKGEDTKRLHTITRVKSAKGDTEYIVNLVLTRKSKKDNWSMKLKGQLRCTCPAFHYYLAYPDGKSKNLYGDVRPWNKVANKVKNPKKIPSLCKHGMAALSNLIHQNIIKRS